MIYTRQYSIITCRKIRSLPDEGDFVGLRVAVGTLDGEPVVGTLDGEPVVGTKIFGLILKVQGLVTSIPPVTGESVGPKVTGVDVTGLLDGVFVDGWPVGTPVEGHIDGCRVEGDIDGCRVAVGMPVGETVVGP